MTIPELEILHIEQHASLVTLIFRAERDVTISNITFDQWPAETLLREVVVANTCVFRRSLGVPLTHVVRSGFLRGVVKGATLRGGLDVEIDLLLSNDAWVRHADFGTSSVLIDEE